MYFRQGKSVAGPMAATVGAFYHGKCRNSTREMMRLHEAGLMSKVVIEANRCKGCELCIHFCPPGVLALSPMLNSRGFHPAVLIDEARCTSCAVCAMICPDTAIIVYRMARGEGA